VKNTTAGVSIIYDAYTIAICFSVRMNTNLKPNPETEVPVQAGTLESAKGM
jgi:hypothetical protein